jgi:hypothetical protein
MVAHIHNGIALVLIYLGDKVLWGVGGSSNRLVVRLHKHKIELVPMYSVDKFNTKLD